MSTFYTFAVHLHGGSLPTELFQPSVFFVFCYLHNVFVFASNRIGFDIEFDSRHATVVFYLYGALINFNAQCVLHSRSFDICSLIINSKYYVLGLLQ